MIKNSIEEDIELLQDETSSLGLFFKCKGSEKYKIALEHILSDYKRALKENEELKDRIREHIMLISPYYVKENYIPKTKIEEILEKTDLEIKKLLESE